MNWRLTYEKAPNEVGNIKEIYGIIVIGSWADPVLG